MKWYHPLEAAFWLIIVVGLPLLVVMALLKYLRSEEVKHA